jgi:DNA-directed RNA polymerase subunit beta'
MIVDPIGRLIERPVRSNFKEGIKLTEFLLSCYGARKGIVDTALRTAKAGYLTRRLVDISHFQVISIKDCNTQRGVRIFPLVARNGQTLIPLVERRKGRALSSPLPGFGPRNIFLDTISAQQVRNKYPHALYRSPLICRTPFLSSLARLSFNSTMNRSRKRDVAPSTSFFYRYDPDRSPTLCQYCYGWSLTEISLVHIGEAVGILAAQSIGEPGTQLTIRTFHTGGVFLSEISETLRRPTSGQAFFKIPLKGRLARSNTGRVGFLTREPGLILLKGNENAWKKSNRNRIDVSIDKNLCQRQTIAFPSGVLLLVRQAQWVSTNSILALIGPEEFSHEGNLIVKIHRIPYRREIFFEDVSLKKLFSYTEIRESIQKESSRSTPYLFSIDPFQRLQTGDFSRLLLKSAEPLGIIQKITHPFCFPWEKGDFVGSYTSLTKIEVRKPVACLPSSKKKMGV